MASRVVEYHLITDKKLKELMRGEGNLPDIGVDDSVTQETVDKVGDMTIVDKGTGMVGERDARDSSGLISDNLSDSVKEGLASIGSVSDGDRVEASTLGEEDTSMDSSLRKGEVMDGYGRVDRTASGIDGVSVAETGKAAASKKRAKALVAGSRYKSKASSTSSIKGIRNKRKRIDLEWIKM